MQAAETVLIENIRTTGEAEETQLRERTCSETVEQYAEAMQRGDRFPLVDLVPVGDGTFYIADGWHRVLAHRAINRGIVDALIIPVEEGAEALTTAKRHALRANQKHGLSLTRGDQQKRARVALLMPEFQGWSLRQLESEIGVGKSTVGRVRTMLLQEGLLPWGDTGEALPEFIPAAYATQHKLASDPFGGDYELKEEAFRFVARLAAFDPRDWEFVHADDDGPKEHLIIHRGLIEGKTLRFPLEENPITNGMPERYEEVPPEEPEGRVLSAAELDRLQAIRARREFFTAKARLMKHPDKQVRHAVQILAQHRQTPGLWSDLAKFLLSGGPDEEHQHSDF